VTEGVVVIGIGNPWRRDDGAGTRVVELARDLLPRDVEVVESDGEGARLLEAWAGARAAFVADALHSGAPPGTVRRLEIGMDPLPSGHHGSTHAVGLGEAVALSRALGRLPERLVVYAVEGADYAAGSGLTPAAEAGARYAAQLLATEVATILGRVRPEP
jgi:hydrogenase maturation protease